MLSPAPKRRVLDELSWEDRQKLLGMSLAQINHMKREDILRTITLPVPFASRQPSKHTINEPSGVEEALKKLARGADDYPSLKDYARALIKKWDTDLDGIISFAELCDGLKSLNITLTLKDRMALMKRMDLNSDGQISDIEVYRAMSSVETQLTKDTVDQAMRKIVLQAEEFANLKEYCKVLVQRFDGNQDGLIQFKELTEGLKKMGVSLNKNEQESLMRKLDLNLDGEITSDELYKALKKFESQTFYRPTPTISVNQAL